MRQEDATDTPPARVRGMDQPWPDAGSNQAVYGALEERELESMRLEWSYLRGRDDYKLRRESRML